VSGDHERRVGGVKIRPQQQQQQRIVVSDQPRVRQQRVTSLD